MFVVYMLLPSTHYANGVMRYEGEPTFMSIEDRRWTGQFVHATNFATELFTHPSECLWFVPGTLRDEDE